MRDNLDMPFLPASDISPSQVEASIARTLTSFAPDIVRIRYSFEDDWSGDAALYFRVLLSDAAAAPARLLLTTRRIAESLRTDLRPEESGRITYFNFRSEAEQRELKDPDWA